MGERGMIRLLVDTDKMRWIILTGEYHVSELGLLMLDVRNDSYVCYLEGGRE